MQKADLVGVKHQYFLVVFNILCRRECRRRNRRYVAAAERQQRPLFEMYV